MLLGKMTLLPGKFALRRSHPVKSGPTGRRQSCRPEKVGTGLGDVVGLNQGVGAVVGSVNGAGVGGTGVPLTAVEFGTGGDVGTGVPGAILP